MRAWLAAATAVPCGAACASCASPASPPASAPPAARHVVLLDFAEGTHGVTAGEEDDATRDVSQLCSTSSFARWEAPRACAGGDRDACRDAVLREVQRRFEAYDVDFTLTRLAAPARYTTLVIAPPDAACTFGQRGVAFADCGDANPASLGMVFDCHGDASSCAVLVAHEGGPCVRSGAQPRSPGRDDAWTRGHGAGLPRDVGRDRSEPLRHREAELARHAPAQPRSPLARRAIAAAAVNPRPRRAPPLIATPACPARRSGPP